MKNSIKNTLCSFYVCFLFLVIGTMVSCKSNSVPLSTKTEVNTITIKEVIKDSLFEIPKDSSYYKAWLDCYNGKVILKGTPEVKAGNYLNPPKVSLFNNQLKIDCTSEAQRLFVQWKETYILESKQGEITIPVPYQLPLTYWQTTQIWCGRIFIGLILLGIVYLILKFKKII
jgi:hypothetical protein